MQKKQQQQREQAAAEAAAKRASSSSSSSSNSSSNSQAALVEDPEVGVAPRGAGRLQGKSFAMAVLGLGILLSTAQRLQLLWISIVMKRTLLQ